MVDFWASRLGFCKEGFWHLTLNDLLTLFLTIIGVVVAVCQFRRQMRENRNEQIKANRTNWYLSVIVIPQLNDINAFYKQLVRDLDSDFHHINDVVVLSRKQADRKEQINAFFDHIQSLIQSYDPSLSKKISNLVCDLEDDVTIALSNWQVYRNPEQLTEIRRTLLSNKKDIITALYQKTRC